MILTGKQSLVRECLTLINYLLSIDMVIKKGANL